MPLAPGARTRAKAGTKAAAGTKATAGTKSTTKSAPTPAGQTTAPAGDIWTARPWVHPNTRSEVARAARKRVPRTSHAAFEPRPDRDPIAILDAQV